ncbi:MAG: hypothetical protein NC254_08450 [bacterium]|nr:hypothetical protein [bacterium]
MKYKNTNITLQWEKAMEKFNVTLSCLMQRVEEEQKMAGTLAKLATDILVVNTSLSLQMRGRENLKNVLQQLAGEVNRYSSGMRTLYSVLSNVRSEYGKTEQHICEKTGIQPVGKAQAEVLGAHAEIDVESKDAGKTDCSLLWKAVGAAGPMGKAVSTVGRVVTSDKDPTETLLNGVSDVWKTGWSIADTVKKCKKDTSISWLQAGLGFDSSIESLSKSNLSSMERALHGKDKVIKGMQRKLKTTRGRVKQGGGIILSAAVNAVSNYKEYQTGAISAQRAVAETVTETTVDWGKNLLIDAAVTAGFAAAGIAAPALVVGVATVAVSVAVDWVSEKICGKKLTEVVSDCILDGAETVANWTASTIKTGAKKVKEGATILWSGLTKGWESLTGGKKLCFA